MRRVLVPVAAVLLVSCGSGPAPSAPEATRKAESPKPVDESRRFPKAGLAGTELVNEHLLGKAFMPGGTLARYKDGRKEYEMFVAHLPSTNDAALAMLEWKKELKDPKFVASFGGYFGRDSGSPVFVFSKGEWVAGIKGLPEKEADMHARTLAGRL
jgi:hypothetical protein